MYKKQLKYSMKFIIIFLVFIHFISACSREVESRKEVHTDLKAIMDKRKLAIENKDIEAYKKLFYTGYQDGGVNYDAVIEDMKYQFANHDKIEFSYEKNPMNFTMNTARMVSMVSYKIDKMEKPVFHHEKTIFRRVDGQWYISGGVGVSLF